MNTEVSVEDAKKKQEEIMHIMAEAYQEKLDDTMGQLHNQFIAFISSAALPLPQVLLVLKMVESELISTAYKKYLGE